MAAAVTYEPLAPDKLKALKLLNSILFPVKFHDQMYRDALACGDVSQLAYVDGTLVGAIMCRLEAQPGGRARLYVASLGVLAPYRGGGIGQRLLDLALAACAGDPAIATAALHVHASNDDAAAWYQKRGFAVKERVEGYYPRLSPPDAFVLERRLAPLRGARPGEGQAAAAAPGAAAAAAATPPDKPNNI